MDYSPTPELLEEATQIQNELVRLNTPSNETRFGVSDEESIHPMQAGSAFLLHTMELSRAALTLLNDRQPGAALALERPLFEAFVRGWWFTGAARSGERKDGDGGLSLIRHYEAYPTASRWKMQKLMATRKPEDKPVMDFLDDTWNRIGSADFNDSAHSGRIVLSSYFRDNDPAIQLSVPRDRQDRLIKMASIFSFTAVTEMLHFRKGLRQQDVERLEIIMAQHPDLLPQRGH